MDKAVIDVWGKVRIIGTLIASIAIPFVLAMIGHWYTSDLKEKEFGIRYVELAISILSNDPQDQTNEIRRWAIDIVNTYSTVKMPSETKSQLLENKIVISDLLDGNMKPTKQLFKEVQELMNKWEQIQPENPLKELHDMAKPRGK